jgi:hypothetical protein
MRNPARSDPSTTQSDGQSVHIVHSPKFAVLRVRKKNRVPNEGTWSPLPTLYLAASNVVP